MGNLYQRKILHFTTFFLFFILIINIIIIKNYKQQLTETTFQLQELLRIHNELSVLKNQIENAPIFEITAYDLSVQSTGKSIMSRGYGITRSGYNLRGQNWQTTRVIAVDPNIIPLGSVVYIKFIDKQYKKYDGLYMALDTGSRIKGNKIDIFIEDCGNKTSKEAIIFGKTKAKVILVK